MKPNEARGTPRPTADEGMHNLEWPLFAIRTRIEMRLNQINVRRPLRLRVIEIISRITHIPRLTAFARRLETRGQPGREFPDP